MRTFVPIDADVRASDAEFGVLETDIRGLDAEIGVLETDVRVLDTEFGAACVGIRHAYAPIRFRNFL